MCIVVAVGQWNRMLKMTVAYSDTGNELLKRVSMNTECSCCLNFSCHLLYLISLDPHTCNHVLYIWTRKLNPHVSSSLAKMRNYSILPAGWGGISWGCQWNSSSRKCDVFKQTMLMVHTSACIFYDCFAHKIVQFANCFNFPNDNDSYIISEFKTLDELFSYL